MLDLFVRMLGRPYAQPGARQRPPIGRRTAATASIRIRWPTGTCSNVRTNVQCLLARCTVGGWGVKSPSPFPVRSDRVSENARHAVPVLKLRGWM